MAFPKIFNKLFKNAGAGPDLNEEIVTNVVRDTGDEIIAGNKTFTPSKPSAASGGIGTVSSICLRNPNITKGSIPEKRHYDQLVFADATNEIEYAGTDTLSGRLGLIEYWAPSTDSDGGHYWTMIACYKNSSDPADNNDRATLTVGYDSNGIKFAQAPSTSEDRTTGIDILTRDWIPKDTRIVHRTGDETIQGRKTFYSTTSSYFITLKCDKYDISSTVSSNVSCSYTINDVNGSTLMSNGAHQASGDGGDIYAYLRSYYASGNNFYGIELSGKNKWFRPSTTKILSLGSSNRLWTTVYAQTSTINTSDERLKSNISTIPDNVLDAWGEINFSQFQFNDSIEEKGTDKARLHSGLIAQRVDEAFKKHNADASRYGFFCYDEWKETPEERNEDGSIEQEFQPAGNQYSLRYEEALCMEAAYQRRRADRAEERIAALEQKVAELERKVA